MSTDLPVSGSQPSNAETSAQPSHPDGGYGWVCVGACFAICMVTWGAVASVFAVYLSHYLASDYFPEATSLDYALIGGLYFAFSMLIAPVVTIITRKWDTKPPMIFGTACLTLGYISASFAHRIWQLYLSQGVLIGVGIGFCFIPSIAIISQWFHKKRSLVNGIVGAGSGIGGLIFSFMTEAIIRNLGLPWAFRITGMIACVVLSISTMLLKNRNDVIRPPQLAFDTKLLRRPDVLLLLAWGFISMLGYVVLLYSLPDFARSIGLSSTQAATTNALLNLGVAVGRPLTGLAGDRFGRLEVAGLSTFVCGVLVFAIWMPANSFGVLILFALTAGQILGGYWVYIGPLCVEVAGITELQSMLSLSWMSTVLPIMFTEVIALKLRRPGTSHPYRYPQIFSAISYICASVCLFFLWRLKKQEKRRAIVQLEEATQLGALT